MDNKHYTYYNFYYANSSLAKRAFDAMFIHEKQKPLNQWSKLLLSNAIKIRRADFHLLIY